MWIPPRRRGAGEAPAVEMDSREAARRVASRRLRARCPAASRSLPLRAAMTTGIRTAGRTDAPDFGTIRRTAGNIAMAMGGM